jgi:hypothetical protein
VKSWSHGRTSDAADFAQCASESRETYPERPWLSQPAADAYWQAPPPRWVVEEPILVRWQWNGERPRLKVADSRNPDVHLLQVR